MDLDDLALRYACPYCLAGVDEWCVRRPHRSRHLTPERRALLVAPTGRSAYLHDARTRPVWDASQVGWGLAVDEVASQLDGWADQATPGLRELGAALHYAASRIRDSWLAHR